jgi:hypothetical protein
LTTPAPAIHDNGNKNKFPDRFRSGNFFPLNAAWPEAAPKSTITLGITARVTQAFKPGGVANSWRKYEKAVTNQRCTCLIQSELIPGGRYERRGANEHLPLRFTSNNGNRSADELRANHFAYQ